MKRKYFGQILIISALLLFQSCHIQIENNRRITISGTVVDSQGSPISNISIRSEVFGEVIGASVSDENGKFEFVSLEAQSSKGLDILVNVKPSSYEYDNYYYGFDNDYGTGLPENDEYSGKRYFNPSSNREESSYNLGRIQLNEIATLSLFLNNLPGDENVVSYYLEYTNDVCKIDVNLESSPDECVITQGDYITVLDPESQNTQVNLQSQLGTSVFFKYQLNNQPEQTISIPLTNSENSYVFEY